MEKKDNKWYYFIMSLGSVFIVLSASEGGALEHLVLGLALIALSLFLIVRSKKR